MAFCAARKHNGHAARGGADLLLHLNPVTANRIHDLPS